jgi:hypothetical protein
MNKYPLIGVTILAVVLLILGSLSNVVGFESIQSSQQNLINERINQRELLFQTICDIANNNEIQRIILKSQMISGKFLGTNTKLPTPITKQQLRQMYFIGFLLSKFISKTRMQSMVQQHQLINPAIQKEISNVIEKDVTLNNEMLQLSNFNCNCENENTTQWSFPLLCLLLIPFLIISIVYLFLTSDPELIITIEIMGYKLHCSWYSP